MFSYRFKVENPIYFPFRFKKDPSNMTYGNTDMAALHKVSNQRIYKKIFIILHHGAFHLLCTHLGGGGGSSLLYISIAYYMLKGGGGGPDIM